VLFAALYESAYGPLAKSDRVITRSAFKSEAGEASPR
jgi:hypothetical protein